MQMTPTFNMLISKSPKFCHQGYYILKCPILVILSPMNIIVVLVAELGTKVFFGQLNHAYQHIESWSILHDSNIDF